MLLSAMSVVFRDLLFLSAIALMGCASGSITKRDAVPGTSTQAAKFSRPSALYVGRFDTSKGHWATQDPQKREAEAREFEATLRQGLLERLPAIAPTQPCDGSKASGWLITGETLHVDPGNAALRALVAAGAGQSKARMNVRVFDLTRSKTRPIASFEVYADSGAGLLEPGGVAVMATDDTRRNIARICREIRDEIKRLIE